MSEFLMTIGFILFIAPILIWLYMISISAGIAVTRIDNIFDRACDVR